MIYDFIKREPDLSRENTLDDMILNLLSWIYFSYDIQLDEGLILDPDKWSPEKLNNFELQVESIDPIDYLLKIGNETLEITKRINIPLLFKYTADSNEDPKKLGIRRIHSYKDRPLFNLNGEYSLICSILALRILIPMKESSEINVRELVTATKLIQAIPQSNLICAISRQISAETLRHYDGNKIDAKHKAYDEDPINAFKKEIVLGISIEYLFKDHSLSITELTKKVSASVDKEIDKLMSAGEVPDADANYNIRSTTLTRWITEAKTIFEDAPP